MSNYYDMIVIASGEEAPVYEFAQVVRRTPTPKTMSPVSMTLAAKGLLRLDASCRYGPAHGWASVLLAAAPALLFTYIWDDIGGIDDAGRIAVQHGATVRHDYIPHGAYDLANENGFFRRWLAEAGWPIGLAAQAIPPQPEPPPSTSDLFSPAGRIICRQPEAYCDFDEPGRLTRLVLDVLRARGPLTRNQISDLLSDDVPIDLIPDALTALTGAAHVRVTNETIGGELESSTGLNSAAERLAGEPRAVSRVSGASTGWPPGSYA